MKYAVDTFFDLMYSARPAAPLCECESAEQFETERAKRLAQLECALGLDKLKGMNFEVKTNRVSENKYEADILPGLKAPIWILKPEHPNGKNVLYLPGHDANGAQGSFNYYGQNVTFHKWLPLRLQFEGFTVVIPELFGFGGLMKQRYTDGFKGCFSCTEILRLFGISMAGMRTYQALLAADITESVTERPVSFIYGISGGGLIAILAEAFSRRAEAAVISNYGASYKSSLMEIQHCVDNYIPGLLNIGECADIIGLCAPVPLMLTNGEKDPIFPVEGVRETASQLERLYKLLGAEDSFRNHLHSGGHEADSDAVIDFLKSFLPEE